MPWWLLERPVRVERDTEVAARGLSPSRTLRKTILPGFEHRPGSAVKQSTLCSEEVQTLTTAQTTDLLSDCQCILPALIWGSLLMLALTQWWFLWQLQRQMQGCFQLRYHQLRYPKLFLPNHRQSCSASGQTLQSLCQVGTRGNGAATRKCLLNALL